MRLFIGVWPPDEVRNQIAALDRPADEAVRWTGPDNWHVTLRFLGEVGDADVERVVAAMPRFAAVDAELGPATKLLNPSVLVAPVSGLTELAQAVIDATRQIGQPPGEKAFTGHLTVARARGRGRIPRALAGAPIGATWRLDSIALIRSHLHAEGARYQTLATIKAFE